jgi:hypothetical protein
MIVKSMKTLLKSLKSLKRLFRLFSDFFDGAIREIYKCIDYILFNVSSVNRLYGTICIRTRISFMSFNLNFILFINFHLLAVPKEFPTIIGLYYIIITSNK